jgi:hypothetical protein
MIRIAIRRWLGITDQPTIAQALSPAVAAVARYYDAQAAAIEQRPKGAPADALRPEVWALIEQIAGTDDELRAQLVTYATTRRHAPVDKVLQEIRDGDLGGMP